MHFGEIDCLRTTRQRRSPYGSICYAVMNIYQVKNGMQKKSKITVS